MRSTTHLGIIQSDEGRCTTIGAAELNATTIPQIVTRLKPTIHLVTIWITIQCWTCSLVDLWRSRQNRAKKQKVRISFAYNVPQAIPCCFSHCKVVSRSLVDGRASPPVSESSSHVRLRRWCTFDTDDITLRWSLNQRSTESISSAGHGFSTSHLGFSADLFEDPGSTQTQKHARNLFQKRSY